MQRPSFYIILCIHLCFLTWSGAQEYPTFFFGLPKLEPSYIDNFNQNIRDVTTCFQDFVEGEDGRIWLSPCFNHIIIYALHLVQFDGYDFIPIDLGEQLHFSGVSSTINGVIGQNKVFGSTNDSKVNVVFIIDLESRKVKKFDFSAKGIIKNVIKSKEDGLIVLLEGDRNFNLFSIQLDSVRELTSVVKRDPLGTFPYANLKKLPLLENDQGIWFMANYFPLYQFDRQTGHIMAYEPSYLKDSLTVEKKFPNDDRFLRTNLVQHKDELILLLPGLEQKRFRFDLRNNRILPENGFPNEWKAHYIANDQKGNLLRLFKDKMGRFHAILEDQRGDLYDYSAFVNVGENRIEQIKSSDFFDRVFVCRRKNFISMGVRDIKGLQTFAFEVDPFRNLWGSLPDNSFLIPDRRNNLYILQENKLKPYSLQGSSKEDNCLLFSINQKEIRYSLVRDSSGRFWGCHGNQLIVYDPQNQACDTIPIGLLPVRLALLNDSTLVLFEGQNRSFYLFDIYTHQTQPLIANGVPVKISNHLFDPYVCKSGYLWQPTPRGLWKIDSRENKLEILGLDEAFPDFRFQDMCEDQDGNYWLGTFAKGIIVINGSGEVLQVIDEKKGLAGNSVRMIVADNEGFIWAATQNGLSLLSSKGEIVVNLNEKDGLPGNEFLEGGHKARNGQILFKMPNGLVLIDPIQLKASLKKKSPGQVFLTEITRFDSQQNKEVSREIFLPEAKTMVLPATHRYLKLKFALSNYVRPQFNRFAYMLEGKDKNWTYIGVQRELNLSHLPAGKYRLLIKGSDYRNNWTPEPLRLSIHAHEFFYKQSWFYALIFGLTFLLAFFWIRRLRFEKIRLEAEVKRRTRQIRSDKELIEQQARELRQLDALKSRFFINISHELRTPITLITAPVEQLLRKPSQMLGQGVRNSLRMVLKNGRNLLHLVEELLELSRLEADKLQLKESPTPLLSFSRQLFSAFESRAAMKNIQYTFTGNLDENCQYWVDRKRLEKIINNLLSNALKFTPKGGSVVLNITTLGVFKTQRVVIFKIKDTGRGIPPEDLPHVFDRYFQTKNKSLPTEGGTGIGLALAKELAELMQGSLKVDSEYGEGSIFTLCFPLKKVEPEEMEAIPMPTATLIESTPELPVSHSVSVGQRQGKLLIVEDNPEMQNLIQSILSEAYDCLITNNGAEAWELLQFDHPAVQDINLILSDVMMPQMDGFTLLHHIKEHLQWRQIPVIMLTARAAEESKLKALRMGVDDYLIKPFSPNELLVRVANLIQNYQRRQAFNKSNPQIISVEFDEIASADQNWLKELEELVVDAIDKKLDVKTLDLADQMAISGRQLLRRLKALTGLSTKQYIQEVKLQKARHLLESNAYHTISEVAYASGFNSPKYFSKIFEKQYGKRPRDYFD